MISADSTEFFFFSLSFVPLFFATSHANIIGCYILSEKVISYPLNGNFPFLRMNMKMLDVLNLFSFLERCLIHESNGNLE